uniref:LRAT domain-containing protein n=1 Tax=Panagrolaimus sp. PS1159 TaxID=55785 RepID=A0AC35G2D3_9BILA
MKTFFYRIVKCEPDCNHAVKGFDRCFLPGDYLTRELNGFKFASHAGIYCGRDKVVHFDDPDNAATIWVCITGNGNHHVHLAPMSAFVVNPSQEIKIVVHCFQQSKKENKVKAAVKLATEQYGLYEYRFLTNNCQHFASLISTGRVKMIDREIIEQGAKVGIIAAIGIAAVGVAAYYLKPTAVPAVENNNVNEDKNDKEQKRN